MCSLDSQESGQPGVWDSLPAQYYLIDQISFCQPHCCRRGLDSQVSASQESANQEFASYQELPAKRGKGVEKLDLLACKKKELSRELFSKTSLQEMFFDHI